jgi:hypothetical protein
MTDATIYATMFAAFVAVLPATITAIAGLVVALRNGRKTDAVAGQAHEAAAKASVAVTRADELATGQQEIHDMVNSNLEKLRNELADARGKIETLERMLLGKAADGTGDKAPIPVHVVNEPLVVKTPGDVPVPKKKS